jgi:GntR family transcriptional regulator/MocR family aminotransferase
MAVEQTNRAPADTGRVAWDLVLDLDAQGQGPLHERLKRALRSAVTTGRIGVGSAVPPSRQLAKDLGISRWAVTEAYAQLVAEGYLEARSGSATRVRWAGPRHVGVPGTARPTEHPPRLDLRPGLPDLRAFPRTAWARALTTVSSRVTFSDLGLPEPGGHPRLRAVLGHYLQRSRGVSLDGAALAVTTGATDGVREICGVLAGAGVREVAVENPGWKRLHQALGHQGLRTVPVPVDDEGLRVDALERSGPGVRAVVVTAAHQFPTGVVLSPRRRRALLAWADAVDGVVIEDDYDAEFRYDRAPVAALQGMRPDRVVLVGSVSKTMSPAMRLGWRVAPARWSPADPDPGPSTLDQLAFAELVTSGAYERHLRQVRRRYRSRRNDIVHALGRLLPSVRVTGAAAGLHLVLQLRRPDEGGPSAPAEAVAHEAARRGLGVTSLSAYSYGGEGVEALVVGYANLPDRQVTEAVATLADVVTHCAHQGPGDARGPRST